jgi:hypothetical protein
VYLSPGVARLWVLDVEGCDCALAVIVVVASGSSFFYVFKQKFQILKRFFQSNESKLTTREKREKR